MIKNDNDNGKIKHTFLWKYLFLYTILFNLIFLFGYLFFFQNNKSFIWNDDPYLQYYPALIYIGNYYKAIIRSLLSGDFTIPLYDFHIGLGGDILSVFSYYGLGDIFLFSSALIPDTFTEHLFNFLIVFRMYCSGLAFSAYCFYRKKRKKDTILGAIIYVFCGYSLRLAVHHPFFINPMIYVPLLAIGIDKILKKEKPYIFLVTAFWALLSGFYFYYMATIFLIIYAFIRFFAIYQDNKLKEFIFAVSRCLSYYLLAIMMASFHLLPSVFGYFKSSRTNNNFYTDSWLHFDGAKYINMFLRFIAGPFDLDYLGLASICLLPLIFLFTQQSKKWFSLKAGFFVATMIAVIPFGSFMMNGFGYISFRWTFMFSFLVSYITVCMLPYMLNMNSTNKRLCMIVITLYGVLCFISDKSAAVYNFTAFFMLFLIYITLNDRFPKKCLRSNRQKKKNERKRYLVIIMIVSINLIVNANIWFRSDNGTYMEGFIDRSTAFENIYSSQVKNIQPTQVNDFYRIDARLGNKINESILLNYNSISTYFSLINSNHSSFLQDLEVSPSMEASSKIDGFDDRTFLNSLASVKYKVPNIVDSYGYFTPDESNHEIYENNYALPIGYTYTSYLPFETYTTLNPLEKQEVLLHSAVLEENIQDYPLYFPQNTVSSIPYDIVYNDVTWNGEQLIVEKDSASIVLHFNSLANSETYIRLTNFQNKTNHYLKLLLTKENGTDKSLLIRSISDIYNFGVKNYTTNLGYQEDKQNTCTLTFLHKGIYSLDGIEIYCQPMDNYAQQISALTENVLDEVAIIKNQVKGTIKLDKNKILCFSIPYSTGWTAYVDGEKTELLKANGMYMAIKLKPGEHDINLLYTTPGLKAGTIMSGVGFSLCICTFIFYHKKKSYSKQ